MIEGGENASGKSFDEGQHDEHTEHAQRNHGPGRTPAANRHDRRRGAAPGASVSADRLKPLVVELADTLRRRETLLGKVSSL